MLLAPKNFKNSGSKNRVTATRKHSLPTQTRAEFPWPDQIIEPNPLMNKPNTNSQPLSKYAQTKNDHHMISLQKLNPQVHKPKPKMHERTYRHKKENANHIRARRTNMTGILRTHQPSLQRTPLCKQSGRSACRQKWDADQQHGGQVWSCRVSAGYSVTEGESSEYSRRRNGIREMGGYRKVVKVGPETPASDNSAGLKDRAARRFWTYTTLLCFVRIAGNLIPWNSFFATQHAQHSVWSAIRVQAVGAGCWFVVWRIEQGCLRDGCHHHGHGRLSGHSVAQG